ncbi:MAG TPA: Uma2 family endonuclease [Phycisphaerae bacterium]|nr:Uma2 family endonuclease [Phycisphaerae bacterium]
MHDRLVAEPIRLTYEDFCALPDDGRRYEIIDGDLFMSPSPEIPHQTVVINLAAILHQHVRKEKLGKVLVAPSDVLLGEHDIVEPDIIFISKERLSIVTQKNIQGAPDLLIEVLSPSTSRRDVRDKRNLDARSGVRYYWMLDSHGPRVTELQLTEGEYAVVKELSGDAIFEPACFPDLKINLAGLLE